MLNDDSPRAPQRDIVHTTIAEAQGFKGAFGQTTFTYDASQAGAGTFLYQMRMHDAINPGGWLAGFNDFRMPPLHFARALSISDATIPEFGSGPPLAIVHNFGYYPMVQVLTGSGHDLAGSPLVVKHIDNYNLTVAVDGGVGQVLNALVLLR